MQAAGGAALTGNESGADPAAVRSSAAGTSAGAQAPSATSRRWVSALLAAIAAGVLAIDLATKQLAVALLEGQEPVRLLGGAVYLTFTTNSGAAFSLGRSYTFIFPVVALAVLGWIGWMSRRLRSVPWAVSLGLVAGGAGGNLLDRLFREPGPFVGEVVDMVSLFDPYGQVFPIFNAADSALVCGVVLAVLLEFTGRGRDGTRATAAGGAPAAQG